MERPLRVLFLCTGNSARSQIAEALLRKMSGGRIEAVSAGSEPRPEIHPLARSALFDLFGLGMEGQYPKPLGAFVGERLDYVISVCDRANASCPVFPGDTERIHWSHRWSMRTVLPIKRTAGTGSAPAVLEDLGFAVVRPSCRRC